MRARIVVGVIGGPAVAAAVWFGFPYLAVVVGAAAMLGLWEFNRLVQAPARGVNLPLAALWTALFVANGQLASQHGNYAPHLIGGGLLVVGAWALLRRRRDGGLAGGLYTALGPLYAGFLLSHALLLRDGADFDGRDWLLYALLLTFAADTAAFFVGRAVGRRPMAPAVSPGKTWEGFAGGVAGAVGASVAVAALFDIPLNITGQLLVGALLGVVASIGDLLESALKRRAGAKDSGALIPGHGGVLDRMDSLLLTLPVTYYTVAFIIAPV